MAGGEEASVVPTRRRSQVVAAATPRTAAVLRESTQSATVVHSGADAAYLRLDRGGCLAVLSGTARAVPCGLRTTLPTIDLPRGAVGTVGEGVLRTGALEVRVGRLVQARVPALPRHAVTGLAVVDEHPAVRAVRAELPESSLDHLATGDPAAALALLGRGSGLTPVGDDVLCGYLATGVAAGTTATAAVADEVARLAHDRTTTLSAELLACAAVGDVLPEFAELVRRLPDPGRALEELVAVGHTSGAGLALGLTLAPVPSGRTAP